MPTKKIEDFKRILEPDKETTKRVKDFMDGKCQDPDHEPAQFYYTPGVYEHTCPSCGKIKTFTVPLVTL